MTFIYDHHETYNSLERWQQVRRSFQGTFLFFSFFSFFFLILNKPHELFKLFSAQHPSHNPRHGTRAQCLHILRTKSRQDLHKPTLLRTMSRQDLHRSIDLLYKPHIPPMRFFPVDTPPTLVGALKRLPLGVAAGCSWPGWSGFASSSITRWLLQSPGRPRCETGVSLVARGAAIGSCAMSRLGCRRLTWFSVRPRFPMTSAFFSESGVVGQRPTDVRPGHSGLAGVARAARWTQLVGVREQLDHAIVALSPGRPCCGTIARRPAWGAEGSSLRIMRKARATGVLPPPCGGLEVTVAFALRTLAGDKSGPWSIVCRSVVRVGDLSPCEVISDWLLLPARES